MVFHWDLHKDISRVNTDNSILFFLRLTVELKKIRFTRGLNLNLINNLTK